MALAIREDEYEFVDPRPEEMKHVNIPHHCTLSPDIDLRLDSGSHGGPVWSDDRLEDVDHLETLQEDG